VLWQWVGRSVTLTRGGASELSQLMEGTTAGALIPEIVHRGFQDLLEAEVSALTGAQLHKSCPDQRSTHRNGATASGCSPPRCARCQLNRAC
jgi:hypothetical protein